MGIDKLTILSSIFHFLAQILKKIALLILMVFCTKAIPEHARLYHPESFDFKYDFDYNSPKNKLCWHKQTLFNNKWVISNIEYVSSYSYKYVNKNPVVEFTPISSLISEQEPYEDESTIDTMDRLSIEENHSDSGNSSDEAHSSNIERQNNDKPCEDTLKVTYTPPFPLEWEDKITAQENSLFIFNYKQKTCLQLEMHEGNILEATQVTVDLNPTRDIPFHPRMHTPNETMQTYASNENIENCTTPEFYRHHFAFLVSPHHLDGHHRSILISFDNFLLCYHWSKASNTIKPTCTHQFEKIRTLTLSPDGTTVAVTDKNLIWLFDIDENSNLQELVRDSPQQVSACEKCHKTAITGVVFNPVKQDCFVSQHTCKCNPESEYNQWSHVWLIDRTTKSIKHLGNLMAVNRVKKHDSYAADVEKLTTAYFSPDGKWYACHGKKTINFYYFDSIPDPLTGQETVKRAKWQWFQHEKRDFCHATFRPDSDRVIIYFEGKTSGQYSNTKFEELSPKYYLLSPEFVS